MLVQAATEVTAAGGSLPESCRPRNGEDPHVIKKAGAKLARPQDQGNACNSVFKLIAVVAVRLPASLPWVVATGAAQQELCSEKYLETTSTEVARLGVVLLERATSAAQKQIAPAEILTPQ